MKTAAEIIRLAEMKVKAAEALVQDGYFDDGYYLAGYAFELLLKARICKILSLPDFFDFVNSRTRTLSVNKTRRSEKDNLYKPFKVHDYEQLLILSGLFTEFKNRVASDKVFRNDWMIISHWDETLRYSGGFDRMRVESFIQSIKNMMLWLRKHL